MSKAYTSMCGQSTAITEHCLLAMDRLRTVELFAEIFAAVEASWALAVRPFHRPARAVA